MIVELHEALLDRLRAAMPGVSVIAYPRWDERIPLPVAALSLEDMERLDEQVGDGRTAIDCRFALRIIAAPEQENAHLLIRVLAANVLHALDRTFRPLPGHAGHVRVARASDGDFVPELEGYLVWTVEFAIELHVGQTEPPGTTPAELLLGFAPHIGAAHEPDYIPIDHPPDASP